MQRQLVRLGIDRPAGAVLVPLYELPDRLDELPEGELAVHCASGFRASIATSLLTRAGRTALLIDDVFDDHAADHLEVV